MKAFEKYHPLVLFTFFVSVITISMLTLNPIILLISLITSLYFCGMLIGMKELLKSLGFSLIIVLMITITNPIFVHKGETILFFLNSNPVTLEAILYGLAAAFMIVSVFYWFKAYHIVMSSDKFIYLFGKVSSKLSLLLSMILAFIPKFKRQYKIIDNSVKALGIYSTKSYVDRIKNKFLVLSMLITWSLENSVDTADSMRARGYGLKGRTSYSNFYWEKKDIIMLIYFLIIDILLIISLAKGIVKVSYYPHLKVLNFSELSIFTYIMLFGLMIVPTIIEIKENVIWRYLKSKI